MSQTQNGLRILLALCLLTGAVEAAIAKIYKGAELRTNASFTYGRFETRLRTFQRSGALASFFTYNDSYPTTPWNEIDIEILGRYEHDAQFNTITPGQVNHVGHRYTAFNPALDFHTYAIEWTPAYVAWLVDGVEVFHQIGGHVTTLTQSQKLMMNVWNPIAPGWAGVFDSTALPAFAFYDWVSYASYTPGAGTTGSGNNFTPQWRDDFDAFDANRWTKATHTWDGNGCDFVQENVVYQDGYMILCLTDASHLGYQDKQVPAMRYAWANGTTAIVRFTEEVDSTTAVDPAKYLIPGGPTIVTATLRPDLCTVDFQLNNVDTLQSYNIFNLGVKDRWGNVSPVQMKPMRRSALTSFPIRINVGGPAWGAYLADQEWSEASDYGYQDGTAASAPGATISGTTEQEIYRTERYGLAQYRVRVPNGTYRVSLMMSENYFTATGQRISTVTVEGIRLVSNFDLYAAAGKNAAVIRTLDAVSVSDGVLDVHFGGGVDNPLLDGLVIEQVSTEVGDAGNPVPQEFRVSSNYPNPFNGRTNFRIDVGTSARMTFRVFDMLGREVASEGLGVMSPGSHVLSWEANDRTGRPLSSGVYLYAFEHEVSRLTGRFVYLK